MAEDSFQLRLGRETDRHALALSFTTSCHIGVSIKVMWHDVILTLFGPSVRQPGLKMQIQKIAFSTCGWERTLLASGTERLQWLIAEELRKDGGRGT